MRVCKKRGISVDVRRTAQIDNRVRAHVQTNSPTRIVVRVDALTDINMDVAVEANNDNSIAQ